MKTFHLWDKFIGNSYADMINHVLGTNFKAYETSGVRLDEFELPGVIAWFVFMDGSTHGYAPDYLWENRLIGNIITEELVSKNHAEVIQKDDREGHYPLRLAFELLDRKKNFYECRFVGAFALSHFFPKRFDCARICQSNGRVYIEIQRRIRKDFEYEGRFHQEDAEICNADRRDGFS